MHKLKTADFVWGPIDNRFRSPLRSERIEFRPKVLGVFMRLLYTKTRNLATNSIA